MADVNIKVFKIFLASSKELETDRKLFEEEIGRLNKKLVPNRGIFIDLTLWEDFLDVVSETRSQDEYNKAIQESQMIVLLFFSKVGKYTNEEFDIAYKHFKKTKKPKILTYFKKGNVPNDAKGIAKDLQSLEDFREKLNGLQHFPTDIETFDALWNHFNKQLDLIDLEDLLKPSIENFQSKSQVVAPLQKSPDPEALCICIQQSQITIFPPGSNGSKTTDLPQDDFHAKVANILQRLMVDTDLEQDDFKVLGEALFHRLLSKEAQADFKQAYLDAEKNKDKDNCLKIILHFDEDSRELAALPWEYLYMPPADGTETGGFLGLNDKLVLTRRLSGGDGKEKALPPTQLRILVVISKPDPTEESEKLPDEAQEIKDNFDLKAWKVAHKGMSPPTIIRKEVKSKADFEQFIKENDAFQVVHFIGQGHTETDTPSKGLEKNCFLFADGKKLSPEEFVDYFGQENKKPNLLFLHAIRDDRGKSARSLRKMALDLVNIVDGVLAIQLPVESKEITDFAVAFYASLAAGQDLNAAAAKAARDLVKDTATRLKMYGISASFSKESFRIEVAKDDKQENTQYYRCPEATYKGNTVHKDFEFRYRVQYCEKCLQGPLWPCPLCKDKGELTLEDGTILLSDLTKNLCGNGTHFIEDILILIKEENKAVYDAALARRAQNKKGIAEMQSDQTGNTSSDPDSYKNSPQSKSTLDPATIIDPIPQQEQHHPNFPGEGESKPSPFQSLQNILK